MNPKEKLIRDASLTLRIRVDKGLMGSTVIQERKRGGTIDNLTPNL